MHYHIPLSPARSYHGLALVLSDIALVLPSPCSVLPNTTAYEFVHQVIIVLSGTSLFLPDPTLALPEATSLACQILLYNLNTHTVIVRDFSDLAFFCEIDCLTYGPAR